LTSLVVYRIKRYTCKRMGQISSRYTWSSTIFETHQRTF